jgi:ParB-like chromosome segregation protein Spo0J
VISSTDQTLCAGKSAGPAVATSTAHPAADVFPLMSGADFDALMTDIRENGQREPIIVHEGQILDGRNRYRACVELGLAPVTMKWDRVGTPEAYVISTNLRRRHLNESQRAMIAKKLANMPAHRPADNGANLRTSQNEAAELLKVSRRSVQLAAVIQEKAAPELVAAVERGDIPVSTAARLVDLPKARQREIATAGKKAAVKAARRVRKRKVGRAARHATCDPDFEAEPEAAARDIEIERDERIGLAGAEGLADENNKLTKQVELLTRRVAALLEENSSLKYRENLWRERALGAGWKGRENA